MRTLIAAPTPTAARAIAAGWGYSNFEQGHSQCINTIGDLRTQARKYSERGVVWSTPDSDIKVLVEAVSLGYEVKNYMDHPNMDWVYYMRDVTRIFVIGNIHAVRGVLRDEWKLPSQYEMRVRQVKQPDHIAGINNITIWVMPNATELSYYGNVRDYAMARGLKMRPYTEHPMYESRKV